MKMTYDPSINFFSFLSFSQTPLVFGVGAYMISSNKLWKLFHLSPSCRKPKLVYI